MSSGDVYSAWYLNKIVSADDQFSIVLVYQSEKYSDYAISMFPVGTNDPTNKYCELVKNYVDGVRLSQINFSNGNVKLSPGMTRTDLGQYQMKTISDMVNTESKSLDTIKITDNQNFCKNFILYHSYFIDNSTTLSTELTQATITTDTKRLRLDSLQEKTCDNSVVVPPHIFSYTVPLADFAPRRLSFGMDHWGFYNGKTFNAGLIPAYTVNDNITYPGANRESKWPESSYGSLNKISYPTGGSTQFNFEPNDVWLTYPYFSDLQISSHSIDPQIGNSTTQTINFTASANRYKFVLDFKGNQTGNTNSRAVVNGIGLEVNRTNRHAEVIITPGSGSRTYYLSQGDMVLSTQDWATLQIFEILPLTYAGNTVIGGNRIKSIVNNNGITGNDSTTYYNYRSGAQSTGVLYSRPTYVRVLRNDILKFVGQGADLAPTNGCLSGSGDIAIGFTKSPASLRLMETVQGNHIGYNMVEVTKPGNGKVQYQYYGSNIWDQNQSDVCVRKVTNTSCALTIPNWPDAPLPFEFIRGQLKYEGYFNQSGNLLKTIFYYPLYEQSTHKTPATIIKHGAITNYDLYTSKKTRMVVVTSEIPLSGASLVTVDSSFYESPYHHEITRKVSIDSRGNKLESKMKYAFDFRVPNCESISDCSSAYNTSYSNALNTFNFQLNTCSNNGCNCRWPVFQSYRYNWSVARKNYISCRRSSFMDPVNSFKTAHDNTKAGADPELKPVLELQDKYINVAIETTAWTNGQLLGADYTKYEYATNPAGNVYPAKQQAVKLVIPSATFTGASSSNTSISKDSRYLEEASIKFNAGTISELSKKD